MILEPQPPPYSGLDINLNSEQARQLWNDSQIGWYVFGQGVAAYGLGYLFTDNPHDAPELAHSWERGWLYEFEKEHDD